MSVREVFVDKRGIVHVHTKRDYCSCVTVEDLFEVQHDLDVKNDFCNKKHGKTVSNPI